MSQLQLALGALTIVLLVALFLYGKWQERRALRELGATLRDGVGDPLLQSHPGSPSPHPGPAARPPPPTVQRPVRVEPQLTRDPVEPEPLGAGVGDDESGTDRDDETPPMRREPEPTIFRGPGERPPAPAIASTNPAWMPPSGAPAGTEWVEDPLLDFAVELRCAHAVDGVTVYDAATRLVPGLVPTPVHLVVWDARAQQWLRPDRFGFYSDVLVAAQLASRRHALSEADLNRLVAAIQQVAAALDADFDPPVAARVAQQATDLDRLCSRFDVRIGLTLESVSGSWSVERIDAAAVAAGLVSVEPLRWVRADEGGRRLFTLAATAPLVDRLALELDVPTAPADADPLRQLFAAGLQLGAQLSARIVDDNARPIDTTSVAAIEAQLGRLYGEMRAAGVEPAGLRAQRLYG